MREFKDAFFICCLSLVVSLAITSVAMGAKKKYNPKTCAEGVICTVGSQLACYEPELAYAPEFGIVCLK
jgi:hypothetical protein